MAISDEEVEFVKDLFSDLGNVTIRKMFGGLGVYQDGTVFGLMTSDGVLMVKAYNELAQDLQDAGARQFANEMKSGKISKMPYWSLPEDALDDPDLACDWARKSLIQNS